MDHSEKKSTKISVPRTGYWNELNFLADLQKKSGSEKKVVIAKTLIDWARSQDLDLGESTTNQSFTPFLGPMGKSRQLFKIKPYGKMWIDFGYIHKYPQFSDSEKRQEFINRLNRIQGVRFSVNAFEETKNLPFDMDLLAKPDNLDEFITFGTWFFDKVRKITDS